MTAIAALAAAVASLLGLIILTGGVVSKRHNAFELSIVFIATLYVAINGILLLVTGIASYQHAPDFLRGDEALALAGVTPGHSYPIHTVDRVEHSFVITIVDDKGAIRVLEVPASKATLHTGDSPSVKFDPSDSRLFKATVTNDCDTTSMYGWWYTTCDSEWHLTSATLSDVAASGSVEITLPEGYRARLLKEAPPGA